MRWQFGDVKEWGKQLEITRSREMKGRIRIDGNIDEDAKGVSARRMVIGILPPVPLNTIASMSIVVPGLRPSNTGG